MKMNKAFELLARGEKCFVAEKWFSATITIFAPVQETRKITQNS